MPFTATPNIASLLNALRFDRPNSTLLRGLTVAEWEALLEGGETFRLLIPLRHKYSTELPDFVRARIDRALCDNQQRFQKIKQTYSEIAFLLREHDIAHVVLKGFAQCPDYVPVPHHRLQSDIDIFVPQHVIREAHALISACGYDPVRSYSEKVIDHLPALVKRTSWKWRGNYCDPDMPISWELHQFFWNEYYTRISVSGLDRFWSRSTVRELDGLAFPALSAPDHLAYLALNVLRDVLRGNITLHLVYELAFFLENKSSDDEFWQHWQELHDTSLRRLEVVCFSLVSHCFGCHLHEAILAHLELLPPATKRWLKLFSGAPFAAISSPNKSYLWLYLSLINSVQEKSSVFFRQLFPARLPPLRATWIQANPHTGEFACGPVTRGVRYFLHMCKRLTHHVKLLIPTLWQGIRLIAARTNLGFGIAARPAKSAATQK